MPSYSMFAAARRRLIGADGPAVVPRRVALAIAKHQQASEILVSWIQLAVLAIFALLYAVAPKTFSADASFAPVPWALAAYFFFTALRLVLAHRRVLPRWLLVLSVMVDMALLMGLIWSFHLQYEQPPSFYLKAPTLLYVFIFIAIRALRFEPGFVVLAGVVAAIGWLFMVAYAIGTDPDGSMITHDYVHYMTSNSILPGAEVDKIVSILLVTAILGLAIARGRRLLIRSLTDQFTNKDLSHFVPPPVMAQIAAADPRIGLGYTETREATVLYIDIENFTAIGESLTAAELVSTLNAYFAAVAEPIERRGGVICQFQGDAILASFNLPAEHTDHAANAVAAAIDIQRLLARQRFGSNQVLRARIGINSGVVVGGLFGTPNRHGYTVHGDDVNLAARLEQLNKSHGTRILVSEHSRRLAGPARFAFRLIGTVAIRGHQAPLTIYTVDASHSI